MPKFHASKGRKIAAAVVILVIIALIACGVIIAIGRSSIPQFNDGSEYSSIELYRTSGGLYEWSYAIEDTTVAEVVDKKSFIDYGDSDKNDGGSPVEQYVIKGKKAGRTKITLRYGSFADGSVEEERNYTIEVNEKLESRIIEQQ